MQIDGGEGVLMIIKNYTGDILNFETATELLHDSGVKVTTVVIDDDVAVKDSLYTAGRRGVANTVLIEKTRRRSGGAWRLTGRLCGTGA
ncbi:PTS-dependent dihydroxyacetone kinase, dihydroxyacetone-binding subunit [Escherichia coli]|uniref:PTS-dependent dihydroxyacetone kinase, dihydroxyacetone-binding subunit n=1 Tax=Escherichia coli TaxID=562 RepID=A0A2X3KAM6_ECOLX|nr:PTS-dependent dihydroxyacetone kinase, dihydroxyacetone-binding subunit [Escherichia coli]